MSDTSLKQSGTHPRSASSGTSSGASSEKKALREVVNIFESTRDAYFSVDCDWHFTYVNLQAEIQLQKKREELLGRQVWEVFPEAVGTKVHQHLLQAMQTKKGFSLEEYYPPRKVWIDIRAFPSDDGLSVYCRDVSDRKEIEFALEQSLLRFKIAAESCSDLIYEWNISSGRMIWFGNVDETLGYDPNEFPRTIQGWKNALHPEDRRQVLEEIERKLGEKNEGLKLEYRIRCKDGTFRNWVDRGRPLRDRSGELLSWVGATTDVTQTKMIEKDERKQQEQLERIINSLPVLISYVDSNYCYRFNNAAYEKWLARRRDQIVGRTVEEVYGAAARQKPSL